MHRALGVYATATAAPIVDDESALVARYAPLVDRQARRLARRTGCSDFYDDFWNAGALALVDAARRFEPSRDVTFETFVEHRVRGAMLDELRKMDHLPRRLRQATDKVIRAKARLASELGREPDVEEVAKSLNLSLDDVAELELLCEPHVAIVPEIPDRASDALDRIHGAERRTAVTTAISSLDERLRLVLSLHYVEGLTYREIAGILKVSEPRVCQLHKRALDLMRGQLEDWKEAG